MGILNLGVLAHVDAGKTTLTERILFETGVIRAAGSVDKGTTQTDTLELERARGITIQAAVATFRVGDLMVNLIDTPGHADFIAEVERSLRALDAIVLVVSAVEGVQPQTRRLARAIRAARLPLVVFVNKIDRLGARGDEVLDELRHKLGVRVLPLARACRLGEATATVEPLEVTAPDRRDAVVDLLAETSERVIEAFDRTGGRLTDAFIADELRAQIAAGEVVPLFFGSAITGAGVVELLDGLGRWLPRAPEGADDPLSGTVFKIVRRASGEKVVYARLIAGTAAVRQRVVLGRRDALGEATELEERITAIERFRGGKPETTESARAGEIVCLHGPRSARVGDWIGAEPTDVPHATFPAPALESVVRPLDPAHLTRLRGALEQLAEQDPLISLRQRNEDGELSVRLYGEVQKEVLEETLRREQGITVWFGPSRTICIERPLGSGAHVELIGEGGNPFWATIGLSIEPGARGGGIQFDRELGSLPLAFYRVVEETARETLTQGIHGWEVTDCRVRLTHAGFSSVLSTGADFRKLTPFVLMRALIGAGTEVCEPFEELELEIPEAVYGPVCGLLIGARATMHDTAADGAVHRIVCHLPSAELRAVEQALPGLTRGEGGWVSRFAGHVPVTTAGALPMRRRIGPSLLNREVYFAEALRA